MVRSHSTASAVWAGISAATPAHAPDSGAAHALFHQADQRQLHIILGIRMGPQFALMLRRHACESLHAQGFQLQQLMHLGHEWQKRMIQPHRVHCLEARVRHLPPQPAFSSFVSSSDILTASSGLSAAVTRRPFFFPVPAPARRGLDRFALMVM